MIYYFSRLLLFIALVIIAYKIISKNRETIYRWDHKYEQENLNINDSKRKKPMSNMKKVRIITAIIILAITWISSYSIEGIF